jgi:hypothetical protein
MQKTAISLLTCLTFSSAIAIATAAPASMLDHICVVDGLKYMNVQSAISACAGSGVAVIPPTYAGPESSDAGVMDFRHPERVKGLTPVTEFGAKADAVTASDGSSEVRSMTFTAGAAAFVKGRDEGKAIIITGAGLQNGSLTSTVKSVDSPNRVTLADAGGFTANHLTYWLGTDNTSALQAAYSARKPLFLPPGKYLMTGTVKGSSPLFLVGSGAQSVIINDTAPFTVHGIGGHYLDNVHMQAATKLEPLPPRGFPTPQPGTPIALDRKGTHIGYQPVAVDADIWNKLSKVQQAQKFGPTLSMSSDGIHIYRITGDLISIILFDVQYSEVALCDFRAGKSSVGGLALWHTPKDGAANRHDSIHDNTIRYASASGIVWAAAENVSIKHNVVEYNGESGLKNYSGQGDGTYNANIEVTGNHSQYNHYDGIDLSESYPHSNSQHANSVVSDNVSSNNDRTGTFADGIGWKITNNVFENNGLSGMSIDISESVVSGNTLSHNNTLHDPRSHQVILGPELPAMNNVFEHNRIVGDAASGAAITWAERSTGNQLRDNTATGGAVFKFQAPPAIAETNADSHGRLPDRR